MTATCSRGRKERHHPKSSLAVILSIVLDRHGGFPIEVRDAFERQRPFGNVARVVRGIERDAQHVYCYSGNSGKSRCSSLMLVQSRNVPFWRNRNVPSGLSGGVDGGGGIGDERAGARKTYCDRAGVRQGSQPRRGGGAAWDLRSAGQAACSGLSGRGRRRACVAPARARLDAVLAARQDDSPTAEPARAWITGGLATAPLRARVARPLPTPTQPERRRGHSYCAQSGDISIVR